MQSKGSYYPNKADSYITKIVERKIKEVVKYRIGKARATTAKIICIYYRRVNNMEYNNVEKQVLSLMEKTDFRNLSKNDVLTYASKLSELRP